MGGMFFASEDGELRLVFTDGVNELDEVVVEDLEPNEEIYVELTEGRWR